ncbi:MAG: hypothetical protein HY851_08725 [candidate division Zixibacteria bacterium]|nr:hypothetical protein [candidate division Zixibacteria bacterium]
MAVSSFIPAGRTSLVKKGDMSLQVQTEYAVRPSPRITTTILRSGQVLHKIERSLNRPVESFDEQRTIESGMARQHQDVVDIIQAASVEATMNLTARFAPEVKPEPLTGVAGKISAIPGVRKLYRLDNEGNFIGADLGEQFKTQFSFVFKNLREILGIFAELGGEGVRERGVHEIEQDRLYFVSMGTECYIVLVEADPSVPGYGAAIGEAMRDESE